MSVSRAGAQETAPSVREPDRGDATRGRCWVSRGGRAQRPGESAFGSSVAPETQPRYLSLPARTGMTSTSGTS
jgi:hypothetical protein